MMFFFVCVLQILEVTAQVFSHRRQGKLFRMMTCRVRRVVMKIPVDEEGICYRANKIRRSEEVPSLYTDECFTVKHYLFGR